jgi:hypothetical protein
MDLRVIWSPQMLQRRGIPCPAEQSSERCRQATGILVAALAAAQGCVFSLPSLLCGSNPSCWRNSRHRPAQQVGPFDRMLCMHSQLPLMPGLTPPPWPGRPQGKLVATLRSARAPECVPLAALT